MTEKALTPYQANTTAQLARKKIYAGVPDDDVQLALAICQKYDLDPLLRHVVLIKGRTKDRGGNWADRYSVYITRDGLLHAAHQSGVPFSIEFEQPIKAENPYTDSPDIYLQGTLCRDGHPSFKGGLWFSEYVQTGKAGNAIGAWKTHPAAMHQKVVEVYLLRRGFDVSLMPLEEIQSTLKGEIVEVKATATDNESEDPFGNHAFDLDNPVFASYDELYYRAVEHLGYNHIEHAKNALRVATGGDVDGLTHQGAWQLLKDHQAAKVADEVEPETEQG